MKSNVEWQKWGEVDPLYAVATEKGRERNSPNAWTDQEFYDLGRREWVGLKSQWEQYGVDYNHCVEVGCGAGRMTRQLAEHFARISAVDVAEGQLRYARERVALPHVEFHLTDGVHIPLGSSTASAAFSIYVFQHFESIDDATAVFKELKRVLKPGGTLMIQIPLYEFPDSGIRPLFQALARTFKLVSDAKAAANRRLIRAGIWRPIMRRLRFERSSLARTMRTLGFDEVEFRTFRGSTNEEYSFMFATVGPVTPLA